MTAPATLAAFEASLAADAPPAGLGQALGALWWAAKGDWRMGAEWTRAHELAQAEETRAGAWVHAHLHRIEGDLDNAGYWYRQTRRPACSDELRDEWRSISAALLDRQAA